MFVSKAIAILLFVFFHSIFAYFECNAPSEKERSEFDDYYKRTYAYEREDILTSCDDTLNPEFREVDPRGCGFINTPPPTCQPPDEVYKSEKIRIRTNEDGIKDTTKWTSCCNIHERLRTKHDSSDNLIYFEHEIKKDRNVLSSRVEIWNKGKLMRTKYDNVNRSIVQGKTPCFLKVLESKGDIDIILDPEKEPPGLTQKKVIDSAEVYDVIKYHWHPHCKKYHEAKKITEANFNSKEKPNAFAKDGDSSSPYKYYAMIAVCVAIASVVVVRKRRKGGK
ncbi:MAG: hypothetical protein LBH25_05600 [Fibromonadaceae bacterium]|jgi:hypothetical protein|nr:hypothetical protein [Fibromonadaceae bacterium]